MAKKRAKRASALKKAAGERRVACEGDGLSIAGRPLFEFLIPKTTFFLKKYELNIFFRYSLNRVRSVGRARVEFS